MSKVKSRVAELEAKLSRCTCPNNGAGLLPARTNGSPLLPLPPAAIMPGRSLGGGRTATSHSVSHHRYSPSPALGVPYVPAPRGSDGDPERTPHVVVAKSEESVKGGVSEKIRLFNLNNA